MAAFDMCFLSFQQSPQQQLHWCQQVCQYTMRTLTQTMQSLQGLSLAGGMGVNTGKDMRVLPLSMGGAITTRNGIRSLTMWLPTPTSELLG